MRQVQASRTLSPFLPQATQWKESESLATGQTTDSSIARIVHGGYRESGGEAAAMPSPSEIFCALVDAYVAGGVDIETLHQDLDSIEIFVATHQDKLFEIALQDDFEDGHLLRESVTTCYAAFFEAIDLMRDFSETDDPALPEQAKQLCKEANAQINEIMGLSQDNISFDSVMT
jgi:hypothetical protein